MKVKCDYCGAMIDEDCATCPKCGGPLHGANRVAMEQPKTIEELQEWYRAHRLPPEEVTRFFIGKNIQEAKAFGIYKDDKGDFVVYKNKADGSRAIRYQGSDEEYAVNELYQRLRAEIADQKYHSSVQASAPSENEGYTFRPLYDDSGYPDYSKMDEEESQHHENEPPGDDSSGTTMRILAIALFWLITFVLAAGVMNGKGAGGNGGGGGNSGYYSNYDDDDDDSNYGWSYHSNSNSNNNNSSWWDSGRSNDSWDWDSDSSWDSGYDSWDSGSTDWGSDW